MESSTQRVFLSQSTGATLKSLINHGMSFLWQASPQTVKARIFDSRFRQGRPTMSGLLQRLKKIGFQPTALVDVGAYVGDWSRKAGPLFGAAEVFMIDGNPENASRLEKMALEIGPRAHYFIALVGPEERQDVTFFRRADCSTVLPELTSFGAQAVRLPMITLDRVLAGYPLATPVLLKLDVQGFELEALRGGREVLNRAEVVILEVSLLPYNQGAPLFAEVVDFMSQAGFSVFDFCGQFRRQSDQVLFQTDVVFVRNNSRLRGPRKFYLDEA